MPTIISPVRPHLPRPGNLPQQILARSADRRIQQVGAAVLFSVVGATALVLMDGASKKQPAGSVETAFADSGNTGSHAVFRAAAVEPGRRSPTDTDQDRQLPKADALTVRTRAIPPRAAAEPARPLQAMADAESPEKIADAHTVRTQTIMADAAPGATPHPAGAAAVAAAASAIPWRDPPENFGQAPRDEPDDDDTPVAAPNKAASAAAASVPGLPACMPAALQNVLAAVEAHFHGVRVVSTTHLHTDNHSRGSVREKLHLACKAIDIKAPGNLRQIAAFLHKRPEVGGVNTYRNHVVHFDLSAKYAKAADHRLASAGGRAAR